MNIFVLTTGRSGSTTFIEACKHIRNYSCEHESRTSMLGQERLNYPENHIEADNRLSWLLGRLDKKYGDSAFYVHLKRNETDTAHSFTKRYSGGIIKAYKAGILMGLSEQSDPMSVSLDYCDTVNSNIDLFLKDKSRKITINLENIEKDFREFWNIIDAQGEIGASLAEFKTKYNATNTITQPQKSKKEILLSKIAGKIRRLVIKFPAFVRNA
jgi:hypothetical protein